MNTLNAYNNKPQAVLPKKASKQWNPSGPET